MKPLRLLIVDDEPLIRSGIRNGLRVMEGVEVIGECASGAEAIHAIASQPVDLVLLDVQMRDTTGLEVVSAIGPEHMPAVIFITAYDEYAVKAFEVNAVDYLLKPFDDERLHRSIERARERIAQDEISFPEQLLTFLGSSARQWPERIVVRKGDHFDVVLVDSIDWIESANNYVLLHCGPHQHLHSESLSNMEQRLNPRQFMRIHRGRMINLSRVIALYPLLGGSYELKLRGGTCLTSGRQYKDAIQAILRNTTPE